jgi:hypothetical protein
MFAEELEKLQHSTHHISKSQSRIKPDCSEVTGINGELV